MFRWHWSRKEFLSNSGRDRIVTRKSLNMEDQENIAAVLRADASSGCGWLQKSEENMWDLCRPTSIAHSREVQAFSIKLLHFSKPQVGWCCSRSPCDWCDAERGRAWSHRPAAWQGVVLHRGQRPSWGVCARGKRGNTAGFQGQDCTTLIVGPT